MNEIHVSDFEDIKFVTNEFDTRLGFRGHKVRDK